MVRVPETDSIYPTPPINVSELLNVELVIYRLVTFRLKNPPYVFTLSTRISS